MFIGHSADIHSVTFTPDHMSLISIGYDAVFIWDFLGSTGSPPEQDEGAILALGRSRLEDTLVPERVVDEIIEIGIFKCSLFVSYVHRTQQCSLVCKLYVRVSNHQG